MLSVRPKIAELVMQLYGRALHPELVEVFAEKRLQRGRVLPPGASPRAEAAGLDHPGGDSSLAAAGPTSAAPTPGALDAKRREPGYEATIQITSAGHVITWRCGGMVLTEVCASSHQLLPLRRRLLSNRVEGTFDDRVECRGGVAYEVTVTLETATPEAFLTYQKEFDLLALQTGGSFPAPSGGLLHRFDASGRAGLALGAVSYVDAQARDRTFRVRALHTFPDDYALVRTQSTIRLPG